MHSDPAMRAKLFVSFISLILVCYIHKVMMEHQMYKDWTMREMIKNLEKLRVQYIAANRILYPLTKTQREIYACVGLGTPV
jgi:transposase